MEAPTVSSAFDKFWEDYFKRHDVLPAGINKPRAEYFILEYLEYTKPVEKFFKKLGIAGKALAVLEGLATDEDDLFQMLVFKYAHIAFGVCGNHHEDWVKELELDYKRLRRNKVI